MQESFACPERPLDATYLTVPPEGFMQLEAKDRGAQAKVENLLVQTKG